jgi:cytochrome c-type biogenesis protein CcmH/NrfG
MSHEPSLTQGAAALRRPRARLAVAGLAALTLVGAALGAWAWMRPRPPQPPLPELTDADPEVVDAIQEARGGVLRAPRSAAAWGRYGQMLRAHDFGAEANRCFAEAERLDPAEPRWPYLRGLTLVLTEPGPGIDCLERSVRLCPAGPDAPRLRLAEVLLEQGRLDEAEPHLRRALEHDPTSCRARLGLAQAAFAREAWRDGLKRLEGCLQDEHCRRRALTLSAEAWGRLNLAGPAARLLKQAAESPEDRPWPDPFVEEVERLQVGRRLALVRADALARQGRGGEAVALLEATVRRHPDAAQAWLLLGQTLVRLKDPGRAEQALGQAVRVAPETVEAWFQLGVARFFLGKVRSAADAFRETIRLKPDHALAHFNLGHCLKQEGDAAGAAAEFREALRCRPDYEAARAALQALGQPAGPR